MSSVCNEAGRASIAYCVAEKKKVKEEQLEEVTSQVEKHQKECANNENNSKRKRGSDVQQTMSIGLTYQNRSFCAMSNYFTHASSCPSFRTFRDPYFMTMMKTVAGINDFSTLTIERLTFCVNVEHQALTKATKKVVMEHYE